MKLSELIQKAQAILDEHGDMDIFDTDTYLIRSVYVEESDGDYPADWNLPQGLKMARIR